MLVDVTEVRDRITRWQEKYRRKAAHHAAMGDRATEATYLDLVRQGPPLAEEEKVALNLDMRRRGVADGLAELERERERQAAIKDRAAAAVARFNGVWAKVPSAIEADAADAARLRDEVGRR